MPAMLPASIHRRYRSLLPTSILAAFCAYSVLTAIHGTIALDGIAYGFALTPAHYGAIAAVSVTLVAFSIARRFYKYLFALTLVLSALDIIHFGPVQFNAGLTFGDWHLGLNLVCVLAGGTAYLLSYQKINPVLLAPFRHDPNKLAELHREDVQVFKSRFARNSSEELQQRLADGRLIPAAATAIRQLLQERQLAS